MTASITQSRFRYRSVALPAEHGGWGFLVEPMVAGLIVAGSWAGVGLCIAALGAFLVHQPLKTALKDAFRGRTYERTRWAWRFAVAYALLALVGVALAWSLALTPFWLPLAAAAPLAGVQLAYEARNRGRELIPEIAGALALGATAPAIIIAGGGSWSSGVLVWLLLGLRVASSLIYVRARLRGQRANALRRGPSIAAHLAALAVAVLLALTGLVTPLAVVASVLLLARAGYGLSNAGAHLPAKVIGMQEMFVGVLYALLTAAAIR